MLLCPILLLPDSTFIQEKTLLALHLSSSQKTLLSVAFVVTRILTRIRIRAIIKQPHSAIRGRVITQAQNSSHATRTVAFNTPNLDIKSA